MAGFQRQVNQYVAPAVEGDFASANPRYSMLAGESELTSGEEGVTIGRFAWARNEDGKVSNPHPGVPARLGFVHRDQVSIITPFLDEDTMLVPRGVEITLFVGGDFWARFEDGADIGDQVYVDYATGLALAGAPAAATFTGSIGASATGTIGTTATGKVGGSVTASMAGNVLTVSAVTASAHVYVGDTVSGPGGSSDPIPANTTILSQLTGTANGIGTYQVSTSGTSTSAAVAVISNYVTVTAVATGALAVGDVITATGWPAENAIVSQLNGTAGGAGVYLLDAPAQFAAVSTGMTAPSTRLTVTAVASGVLHVGDELTGAAADTVITALGTGTGGTGTYTVSPAQYFASGALTSESDVLDVTAVASGVVAPGMPISGASIDAGTYITEQLTGTAGGIGTYGISPAQAAASTAITGVAGYASGWTVASIAAPGDIAKITTQP